MKNKIVQIECWACKQVLTLEERLDNDGDCPHCNSEINLAEPPYELE